MSVPDIDAPAAERVSAGAEVLDSFLSDWHEIVDLETLSLSSTTKCVLGQLYGSYDLGLLILDWDDDEAIKHGFDAYCRDLPAFLSDEDESEPIEVVIRRRIKELNRLWKAEILTRRDRAQEN